MLDAEQKLKLLIQDRPWEKEPNYEAWVDKETGYECEIKRNPITLSLCGYVTVPKTNPYYGMDYNEVSVQVHGGLTYSHAGTFGFDCAHAGDLTPGILVSLMKTSKDPTEYLELTREFDTYRTFEWVKAETGRLAWQLKNVEKGV